MRIICKILFLIVFYVIIIYSQDIKLGGGVGFLTGNEDLDYQVSPEIFFEYIPEALPLEINGSIHYSFAEISNENELLAASTFTNYGFGAAVCYFPVKWSIQPFLGVGINYNINYISQEGNSRKIYLRETGNNLASRIIAGLRFSAYSSINFIVEASYNFNEVPFEYVNSIYDSKNIGDKLKLNCAAVKIGFSFGL